jgi:hypothetical protein
MNNLQQKHIARCFYTGHAEFKCTSRYVQQNCSGPAQYYVNILQLQIHALFARGTKSANRWSANNDLLSAIIFMKNVPSDVLKPVFYIISIFNVVETLLISMQGP